MKTRRVDFNFASLSDFALLCGSDICNDLRAGSAARHVVELLTPISGALALEKSRREKRGTGATFLELPVWPHIADYGAEHLIADEAAKRLRALKSKATQQLAELFEAVAQTIAKQIHEHQQHQDPQEAN
jgi:hypothetical protein